MKTRNLLSYDERGFSTAWILGIAFIIFLTGAVFFQFGTVLVQRQKLVAAADRAANAGATAMDEEFLLLTDGDDVRLNADPSQGDTAVGRCQAVIVDEAAKDGSIVESVPGSFCTLGLPDQEVITATVKGKVSLGVISSWLGIPEKEFTIVSHARPSCSDSTDVGGDC